MISETNTCKICGNPTETLFDSQLKVTYDICPYCDFISKQEGDLLPLSEEKKRYDTHNNDVEDEGYINMFMNMINPHVRPLKDVKTILDFGSGPYPMLKKLLDKYDYDVTIYDPFYHPVLDYKNKTYDLITSTEVIEHFVNPLKEFEEMISLLNKNGYLCFMTNYRTMDTEGFLKWWYRRDQTHVAFYNEKTFQYLMKKYNLKEISNNHKNIIVMQKQ